VAAGKTAHLAHWPGAAAATAIRATELALWSPGLGVPDITSLVEQTTGGLHLRRRGPYCAADRCSLLMPERLDGVEAGVGPPRGGIASGEVAVT
jgi:hypothetical protein